MITVEGKGTGISDITYFITNYLCLLCIWMLILLSAHIWFLYFFSLKGSDPDTEFPCYLILCAKSLFPALLSFFYICPSHILLYNFHVPSISLTCHTSVIDAVPYICKQYHVFVTNASTDFSLYMSKPSGLHHFAHSVTCAVPRFYFLRHKMNTFLVADIFNMYFP